MTLKIKDIIIMLALMEKPNAKEKDITEIVNQESKSSYAISTINRRIKKLEEKNIIQGSSVHLMHHKLGMSIYHFFIYANREPNWSKNIETFEKVCELHPYTSYRNRIYGNNNGLFVQFRLPAIDEKAYKHLIDLLEILKDRGILAGYIELKFGMANKTNSIDLSAWDAINNRSQFNVDDFRSIMLENHSSYYLKPKKYDLKAENILSDLTMFDAIIMREMTRNGRRNQSQILKDIIGEGNPQIYNDYKSYHEQGLIPSSKQSFSRNLNKLKENVFGGYQLFYDRSQFGVFNHLMITGSNNKRSMGNLCKAIDEKLFPFDLNVFYNEEEFMLWANLPPVVITSIADVLQNAFENMTVSLMGRNPATYWFWHENFDYKNNAWKVSREWMVDNVLDYL